MEYRIRYLEVILLQHRLDIQLTSGVNDLIINLYLEQSRVQTSFNDDLMTVTVQFNLPIECLVDSVGDVSRCEVFQLTIQEICGALGNRCLTCAILPDDQVQGRSIIKGDFSQHITV